MPIVCPEEMSSKLEGRKCVEPPTSWWYPMRAKYIAVKVAAHLENLNSNSKSIPVVVRNILTGIQIEKNFESFQPNRQHLCSRLFHGVRMLVLHHIKRSYALSEDGDSTSASGSRMRLRWFNMGVTYMDFLFTCDPIIDSRTGRSWRSTGSIWSSVKSDLMNSVNTWIAPWTESGEPDESNPIKDVSRSGYSSGQSELAITDRTCACLRRNKYPSNKHLRWLTLSVRIFRLGSESPLNTASRTCTFT